MFFSLRLPFLCWILICSLLLKLSPIPQGQKLQCKIVRKKDGVEKLFPKYELFAEDPDSSEKIFLLSARKRKKTKSSNYIISSLRHSNPSNEKSNILAKVRSNFLGTAFSIYSGDTISSSQNNDTKNSRPSVRKQYGLVLYVRDLI